MFCLISLERNDVLFTEGDTLSDALYNKIWWNRIKKNNFTVELVNAGEIVGIFNVFFDYKIRMFTAVAVTKGEVYIILEKYLQELLNKSDPFLRYCFRTFLTFLNRFS